ncbi:MAG TPA: ATP-binding cassette domain-containing protein [Bacillota bacterium]|nr:ATP-binding cassette domain-containing protein [Bacillota bacterium]
MIEVVNAGFTYGGSERPALEGISLKIEQGSIYGICGSAGSGKSTLAMCLNGAIPHCIEGELTGKIIVDGLATEVTPVDELSSMIGSVFQDVESQLVSSNVEDEILFGLENMGIPRQQIDERILEGLEAAGVAHLRHAEIWNLSGGQKQRVAIAAALALRPRLLVMDEPTSELDPQGSIELFAVLKRLNQEKGITVIIIEQKLDLLTKYCDRIAVMDQGRIVLDGTCRQVLEKQEVLDQVGLQVPPAARLFKLLQEAGVYQAGMPVSEEEAASLLGELLRRGEATT